MYIRFGEHLSRFLWRLRRTLKELTLEKTLPLRYAESLDGGLTFTGFRSILTLTCRTSEPQGIKPQQGNLKTMETDKVNILEPEKLQALLKSHYSVATYFDFEGGQP